MKIALDARFLTHPQVGGFKTYTENLVRALSQVDDVNHYVLYVDRRPVQGLLARTERFTYQVVSAALPVIGMPIREQVTLRKHVARCKPDVVHYLCNTAPVGVRGKFVITLLDTIQMEDQNNFKLTSGLTGLKRWAMTAYSKWTISQAAQAARRVITISDHEKVKISSQLGIPLGRICVTHLAANPVFAPARAETKEVWRAEMRAKHALPRRFVLGVGYEPRKNVPLLIEAFAKVARELSDLDLVIVAAEPGRRLHFQQLAAERDLSSRVTVLAGMGPTELAKLYNLADIFAFPSEREGFGLPPLEAMACGVPTIAMNMSSIPEIVQDGCLLLGSKDPQAWASAILQVSASVDVRERLVARGLEQAARLTWQRCAQETTDVYRTVFEEK